jgi:regulatory protein
MTEKSQGKTSNSKGAGKGRKSFLPRTALQTVMDLLSRREHSEKELKQKLKKRQFALEEIESALQKAKAHGWLGTPDEVSLRLADQLHRKKKGLHAINRVLQEKGLPTISRDESVELEKARRLVKTKVSDLTQLSREQKLKIMRFLASRGFDSSTIRKAIQNDEEF